MKSTKETSSNVPRTSESEIDVTCLLDYRPPVYFIDRTELHIDLQEDATIVSATLQMRRNPNAALSGSSLRLDGINLALQSLAINGGVLCASEFRVTTQGLTIDSVPADFTLETVTVINPKDNIALIGLYQSNGLYCSQCEPQGFRHITYYLDRPDVLSEFVVTIEADKSRFPVLLANGNPTKQGECDDQPGRHWITWHDPFRKPSYLFALVAGRLDCIEDSFTTCSGREVAIKLFAENPNDLAKCHHALSITKQAMRWDEEHYGREYDLDIFMIAVVADLNVGGQENKGLNIYRLDKLLVDPLTTTDTDVQAVTETVAHEYFHNWSGNRVASRDWFQLSLKEGFTTYRGLQFNQGQYTAVVKRIEETQFIRTHQFAEDAGPLAHSIRPEVYRAIWNFYTPTVYQKGAEVVRMLATLLGPEDYRKGTDLFFQRHDGHTATTEDFVAAMEARSSKDLTQFRRWYSQAGTPRVAIDGHYNKALQQFTLTVTQTNSDNPSVKAGMPLHFPLKMSLIGQKGALPFKVHKLNDARLIETQSEKHVENSIVLEVTDTEQKFIFDQIAEKPIPLLFEDFSAPVKWHYDYTLEDLLLTLQVSPNDHSRWEASQLLWAQLIHRAIDQKNPNHVTELSAELVAFYVKLLAQAQNAPTVDSGLVTKLLTLPSEAYLIELAQPTEVIDIDAIYKARSALKKQIALQLKDILQKAYDIYRPEEPASFAPRAIANRALRNCALDYLVHTDDPLWLESCYQQFARANNMTDTMAALTYLMNSRADEAINLKQQALEIFYNKWRHEPLVLNQWFRVQALCQLPGTLTRVEELLRHPAFDIKSPNQVRALIGNYASKNLIDCHQKDGRGYAFLVDQIIALNRINPPTASHTLASSSIINWRRYDKQRRSLIKAQLQRLQQEPKLSSEVLEVVNKCLSVGNIDN